MAQDFVEQFNVSFPVLTDPRRSSYKLAGLKRSFGLGRATLGRAKRAIQGGYRQGMTAGDPWQQGGVLVIHTDGRLLYRHVDDGAGDHAPVEDALAALTEAVAAQQP